MHLNKSPFLCKTLVSPCSSKSQLSTMSDIRLQGLHLDSFSQSLETLLICIPESEKCFMLRLQPELNTLLLIILVVTRGGIGFGVPESIPAGFCAFLSEPDPNPDPELNVCEKPDPDPESLFNFGSSRSLCGHFFGKNMGKLRLDRWL